MKGVLQQKERGDTNGSGSQCFAMKVSHLAISEDNGLVRYWNEKLQQF